MKNVSTRWGLKLLTPIQHASSLNFCQELLQENEINPNNKSDRIVTTDEIWVYCYDRLSEEEAS